MPSPGRIAIFIYLTRLNGIGQPRLLRQMTLFEFADFIGLAQGQSDVIESVDQTVFAELADIERIAESAVERADGLLFKIDRQTEARKGFHFIEQMIDRLFRQYNRQQTVFIAIIEKNVDEARRDHGTKAELIERPGSMLTR